MVTEEDSRFVSKSNFEKLSGPSSTKETQLKSRKVVWEIIFLYPHCSSSACCFTKVCAADRFVPELQVLEVQRHIC